VVGGAYPISSGVGYFFEKSLLWGLDYTANWRILIDMRHATKNGNGKKMSRATKGLKICEYGTIVRDGHKLYGGLGEYYYVVINVDGKNYEWMNDEAEGLGLEKGDRVFVKAFGYTTKTGLKLRKCSLTKMVQKI